MRVFELSLCDMYDHALWFMKGKHNEFGLSIRGSDEFKDQAQGVDFII